jgi:uncharacterized membrane protein HdeD (DUF308 family)
MSLRDIGSSSAISTLIVTVGVPAGISGVLRVWTGVSHLGEQSRSAS